MGKQLVVLGGGISGLSLAWYLRGVFGSSAKISVVEANASNGGWIKSTFRDDYLFERGPRSFRPSMNGVETLKLIEQLGLQDQVIRTSSDAQKRYLLVDGKVQMLPTSLAGVFLSPLTRTVPFIGLKEMFVPPTEASDESIYDFISRRFSPAVATQLLDPVVSGIFAGDVKRLSIASCFPRLWELEKTHGSVVRGMLFGGSQGPGQDDQSEFVRDTQRALSVSFVGGMCTLPQALEGELKEQANTQLLTGTRALRLRLNSGDGPRGSSNGEEGWENETATTRYSVEVEEMRGDSSCSSSSSTRFLPADHVFSTLPASHLASLLSRSQHEPPAGDAEHAPIHPPPTSTRTQAQTLTQQAAHRALVTELEAVEFPSVGMVNLGYKSGGLLPHAGFGYLVPSGERDAQLGMTWDSVTFPEQNVTHRARGGGGGGGGETRLTVMAGGAHHPEVDGFSDDELVDLALKRTREHLGIKIDPDYVLAGVHRHCIPQYYVGHGQKTERVRSLANAAFDGGLTVLGNSFDGVGVSDCVANAAKAAERASLSLRD